MEDEARRRPTLRDVARLAGVSHQTVSRAINDKGEIDPETRRRVLDAARQLRYRPSRFARGLVRPGATTVGLVVSDVVNPFFPELIAGVIEAAEQAGWQVVISSSQDDAGREPALLRSLSSQVDVVIGYFCGTDEAIAEATGDIPLVMVNRRTRNPAWAVVDVDSATGVRALVRHLAAQGHHRLGMIDCPDANEPGRREAFLAEAASQGLTVPTGAVVAADQSMAGGEAGLTRLHAEHPGLTAVFAFNDLVALGAHRAARRLGWAVPRPLALAGFDGLTLGELLDPALTTVQLDKRRLGELAVAQARRLLQGEKPDPVILETTLLVRDSA
ncbi:LacI family DNA-binding transcriptional regulator [Actinoplanes sp. NPDC049596]|uniref:LacI family DNA-binding transcriptional regulator n=1 Tax=unclassified Actinoplanes TaxID=2626549 RepID=UPI0034198029